jgi:uncharacterized membrane protein
MPFIIVLIILFIAPLMGVVFGGFAGFIVGLFFNNPVLDIITAVVPALSGFSLTQIGATLGFVGGFFQSVVTKR